MIILFAKIFNVLNNKKSKSLTNYLIGELLYNLKKYDKATEFYQSYCDIKPRNGYILMKLGNCYHRLGKYSEASETYEKARILDRNNFEIVSNLGLTYYFNKDYEKAVNLFKISLELKPDNYEAWVMLAILSHKLNDFKNNWWSSATPMLMFINYCDNGKLIITAVPPAVVTSQLISPFNSLVRCCMLRMPIPLSDIESLSNPPPSSAMMTISCRLLSRILMSMIWGLACLIQF